MAARRLTSHELHEELFNLYTQFRGVSAPNNTYTQSIWAEIERLEANG